MRANRTKHRISRHDFLNCDMIKYLGKGKTTGEPLRHASRATSPFRGGKDYAPKPPLKGEVAAACLLTEGLVLLMAINN
jgi:hypothetical protein